MLILKIIWCKICVVFWGGIANITRTFMKIVEQKSENIKDFN